MSESPLSLNGLTFKSIEQRDNVVVFTTSDDRIVRMLHEQDCCEEVFIKEVKDLDKILNSKIVASEANFDLPNEKVTYVYHTENAFASITWNVDTGSYYSSDIVCVWLSALC